MTGPWDRPKARRWTGIAQTGVAVLCVALGLVAFIGLPGLQSQPRLPDIVRPGEQPLTPRHVVVLDGDTITVPGRTVRLVGFDTPERGSGARCEREGELAERATAQLQAIVNGAGLTLRLVPCACPRGTEGTSACNYGRACGHLYSYGRDVGPMMIAYRLARPYHCGATSCPPRGSWC